jgi:hypothetical protein
MSDQAADAPAETTLQKKLALYSPEWFAEQKKFFEFSENAAALKLLEMLQIVTSNPPVPDEVKILKHYTGNPDCRTCRGSKRIGINIIWDKNVRLGRYSQVQLCHCAKPIESEYAKLEQLMKEIQVSQQIHTEAIYRLTDMLAAKLSEANKIQSDNTLLLDEALSRIDRHTAGYWIAKLIQKIKSLFKHKPKASAETGAQEVHQPAEEG